MSTDTKDIGIEDVKEQATGSPILGTPLLYQVNVDTKGNAVPIQNQVPHTLAVQAIAFGGGKVYIEWSLDAITWTPMLDSDGQLLSISANSLRVGLTFCGLYLRATLLGSMSANNLTVTIS